MRKGCSVLDPSSQGDRRAFRRAVRTLPLQVFVPQDAEGEDRWLHNLLTTDIGPGGLRFRTFGPLPFAIGDPVKVRVLIPEDKEGYGVTPTGPSILGPAIAGVAIVARVERVVVDGVLGHDVALRFDGALDLDGAIDGTGPSPDPASGAVLTGPAGVS